MIQRLKALLRPYIRPYQRRFRRGRKALFRVLLSPFRYMPFKSDWFGPPTGYYETIEACQAANQISHVQKISQALIQHRPKPDYPSVEIHWKIEAEYTHEEPQAYVIRIPKGRVWVQHNGNGHVESLAILSENDRLIGPLSPELQGWKQESSQHAVFSRIFLGDLRHIKGQALVLATVKGEQFFHWILDLLPKIHMAEQYGVNLRELDAIIVNSLQYPFMVESLRKLGLSADQLICTDKYRHIQADSMIIPSSPHIPGNPCLWSNDWLRDTFMPDQLDSTLPKRIYISRGQAKVRRVSNEAEIIANLEPFGFVPVQLETLPLTEQIALFAAAEIIVAPHGAGLTHLTFCSPGTKVIEFFSPLYVNACFYALASIRNLSYRYLIGEGMSPPEGTDLQINIADITMDVDQLTACLAQAGLPQLQTHIDAI